MTQVNYLVSYIVSTAYSVTIFESIIKGEETYERNACWGLRPCGYFGA